MFKELFTHGRMPEHPQTTLSLCFILSLVYCFHLVVAELECDVSALLKMYYRRDIVVESPTKPCTLCNEFLSLTHFIYKTKPFSLKMWREATSYCEFVCDFRILDGWLVHEVRISVSQLLVPYLKIYDYDNCDSGIRALLAP